jgi:hypothetical protein
LAGAGGLHQAEDFDIEAILLARVVDDLDYADDLMVRIEPRRGDNADRQLHALDLRTRFAGRDSARPYRLRRGARSGAAARVIEQVPELEADTLLQRSAGGLCGGLIEIQDGVIPIHDDHRRGDQVEDLVPLRMAVSLGCLRLRLMVVPGTLHPLLWLREFTPH